MQRRKLRVRWYGEPFGAITRPMLEIKVKIGQVGTKQSYPLSTFQMNACFCDRVYQRVLSESDLPSKIRLDLRDLNVVLFNRYFRHYYATHDGAFRLTLDTRMEFFKVNGLFGNQFIHHQVNTRDVVVELKYENEYDPYADRVASFFPFRMTRSSKYVQGIEKVYF
jgi:hypothetical protein